MSRGKPQSQDTSAAAENPVMSDRSGTDTKAANAPRRCGGKRATAHGAYGVGQEPVTVVRGLACRGTNVLMLRRALGDSLEGCWELPGGKVDRLPDRSEDPLEALAREFEEECGLKLRGTPQLLSRAPRVSPKGKLVNELTYLAEVAEGAECLSEEHDQARWHPFGDPAPGELTEAAAAGLAALLADARA
jgi:ADP-ribose pyrophosphatase YjhB (NUDIX family)